VQLLKQRIIILYEFDTTILRSRFLLEPRYWSHFGIKSLE
jgi:hypothetical protein